jgi:hypothetical protein
MKRAHIKFLTFSVIALLCIAMISCEDDFTEKDALEAQQQVDLTIYVVDPSTPNEQPVSGAKVTVSQGTTTTEVTTDDKGVANFPKIKVGEYVYNVTAENHTIATGEGSAAPDNFRQGQVTQRVSIYSLTGDNIATVKGTATFEKDVTNTTPEPAAGIKIIVNVDLHNGIQSFPATTDAQGNYSVQVPTMGPNTSTNVFVTYPDFEADQTIAFNKASDETGTFYATPQVLPRKENIKTVFSTSMSYVQNHNNFPSGNVRSVYAVAEAAPAGGKRALISTVDVNNLGEVTGVSFHDGGIYTGDIDGKVVIDIFSLENGTGAKIEVALVGNSDVSTAYSNVANRTITKGSGYPTSNYTLNKISAQNPSSRGGFYTSPGAINIANVYYGTGTVRPKDLD